MISSVERFLALHPNAYDWLLRERRTGHLVRLCYKYLERTDRIIPETVDALARLTWITKNQIDGTVSDRSFASTKCPALATIFDLPAPIETFHITHRMASNFRLPIAEAQHLLNGATGIAHTKSSHRNQVLPWISENWDAVESVCRRASARRGGRRLVSISELLDTLPPIPHPSVMQDLPAISVMSLVVACLDPLRTFPIINGGNISRFLRRMGRGKASTAETVKYLTSFIRPSQCIDNFALDTLTDCSVRAAVSILSPSKPTRK